MIGNEEDFQASLGLSIEGATEDFSHIDQGSYRQMIRRAVAEFGFKAAATTLRVARTATFNDWAAMLYCDGEFYDSISFPNLEILDRVGGGDLRADEREGPPVRRELRMRPRRAGHDHSGGYLHGLPGGSGKSHEGRHRPRGPLTFILSCYD